MKLFKLLTAAAIVVSLAGTAFAGETWRMAFKPPLESPEGQVYQKFAELVEEYSDGDLVIRLFPNEQLGKTEAVLEQVKLGTVHIYAEGPAYMKKWVPELSWIVAAFIFDDREHWQRFMNSDLVKGWFETAANQSGVSILGDPAAIVRGPYRVMVTAKPVKTLDDVRGLKLRMHNNKTAIGTWAHLGADVRTLAWSDVYQSISKGIVDAVNSPMALVEAMRFYEVAPYVVRHDEYDQSLALMTNQDKFDALPEKSQKALLRALDDAGDFSAQLTASAVEASIARMKENGVTFTDVARRPFQDRMKSYYNKVDLPEGFLETVEATRGGDN